MSKTKITVNNNGSLKIDGDFEVVDREGGVYNLQGREIVSFCRCGRSNNKPFCDGSHNGHFELSLYRSIVTINGQWQKLCVFVPLWLILF